MEVQSILCNGTLAIVTGRIFRYNNIVAYRVWVIDNGFQLKIVKKWI